MDVSAIGRTLLILGAVLLVLGAVLTLVGRVPFVGRLPGDVEIRGEGWTIYLPIATSVLLSLLLTIVLAIAGWGGGRR